MSQSRIILYLLSLLSLFAADAAEAQVPVYTVVSYYESAAYLTERFIPFAVQDSLGTFAAKVQSIDISKPCYAMVDPYRAYVFHIYCSEPTNASFTVTVEEGGHFFKIPLPSIHVAKLAVVSSTPKPKGPSTGGGDTPLALGRQLFNTNCATCHPAEPIPRNTTPASLKTAFNIADMNRFRGVFTNAQLSALSRYINEGL